MFVKYSDAKIISMIDNEELSDEQIKKAEEIKKEQIKKSENKQEKN